MTTYLMDSSGIVKRWAARICRAILHMRQYSLVCLILTCIVGILSAQIALSTKPNAHPDEFYHMDAFCYFEKHWWLPPLNSNELDYGPYGESRVYSGEVVYFVYGRIGALIKPFAEMIIQKSAQHKVQIIVSGRRYQIFLPIVIKSLGCNSIYRIYRLLNTFLFLITLLILFYIGVKHIGATAIGIALLCVPQIIYIYSYANSDAWGLSFSVFLFLFSLVERDPFSSLRKTIILSVLTGIVFLSKGPYWLSIAFSYILIGYNTIKKSICFSLKKAALFLGVVLLVIAPVKIVYPLTQGGDLASKLEQIRAERAKPGFKPSDPTTQGYRLKSKGVSFGQICKNTPWIEISLKSFYGVFGYMTIPSPRFAYRIALVAALVNMLFTFVTVLKHRIVLTDAMKIALIFAPLVIIVNIVASMYHSWTYDFQPQGRYLFPSLIPITLLVWGTMEVECTKVRIVRIGSMVALLMLCFYVLWYSVLQNEVLNPDMFGFVLDDCLSYSTIAAQPVHAADPCWCAVG